MRFLLAPALAVSAFAALTLGGVAPVAAAEADSDYTCRLGLGTPGSANLSIDLAVPASASPSQSIATTGTVTLELDRALSTALRLSLGSSAELTSDSLSVELRSAGQERPLRMSELTARASSLSAPVTFTGTVELPAFTVPSDATDVQLRTPSEEAVTSPLRSGPERVTFAASIAPKGGLLTQARPLACADGDAATIATIPVDAGSSTGLDGTGASGASGLSASPAPAGDGAGFGTGAGGSSAPPVGDAAAPVAEGDGAAVPGAADGSIERASAPIPPATRDGLIFLPWWLVILLALTLPVLVGGFVAVARRRLARLPKGLRA